MTSDNSYKIAETITKVNLIDNTTYKNKKRTLDFSIYKRSRVYKRGV